MAQFEAGQVLASAGREVVRDPDAISLLQQRLDEVRADEARPAGHHDPFRLRLRHNLIPRGDRSGPGPAVPRLRVALRSSSSPLPDLGEHPTSTPV